MWGSKGSSELLKRLVNQNSGLLTSAKKTLRDATQPDKLLQQVMVKAHSVHLVNSLPACSIVAPTH